MIEQIQPEVFYIGASGILDFEMDEALEALGVPDWESDADDDHSYMVEFAGKTCYMSFDKKLNKNLTRTGTRDNQTYIQEGIIGMHHGSVLEHTTCNFLIKNASRVVTHELVRHRTGTAFSQVSGRYVRTDVMGFYTPEILAKYPGTREKFVEAMGKVKAIYDDLVEASGIDELTDFKEKKLLTSALRRVLPEGRATHIVFSANHRALRHIIAERTAKGAEEEIRVVFSSLASIVKQYHPAIYADMEANSDGEWVFKHRKV